MSKNKRLYVFDMDGTLLPSTTSCLEISRHLGFYDLQLELEMQLKAKVIDNCQFSHTVRSIWREKKIDEKTIFAVFEKSPKLSNIEFVIHNLHSAGHLACLITQSSVKYANFFHSFGFDHIYGSQDFEYDRDKIDTDKILMGYHKPKIVQELCDLYGLNIEDAVAFGDSETDVPLFQLLDQTVAVNGDDILKPHARYHYSGLDLKEAYQLVT
jgi:phosphoserine phosphatase